MSPVLSDGDRVLAVRTPPAPVRRGAVVVGRTPAVAPGLVRLTGDEGVIELEPVHRPVFVKRVTGLPGDRVQPRHPVLAAAGGPAVEPVVVPGGSYFVEGEAGYSQDSGLWGPVPRDRILGLVVGRLRRGPERPDRPVVAR